MVDKSKASSELLELNQKLHDVMSALQSEKKVEKGIAILPHHIIKDIGGLGTQAEAIIKKADPAASPLQGTGGISAILVLVDKVKAAYPPDNDVVKMPGDVASKFTSIVVNQLTNQVHNAAMSFMAMTDKLHACELSGPLDPNEAITLSRYCSGALPKTSAEIVVTRGPIKKATIKGKPQIISYPTKVSHKLGVHRTEVSTATSDKDVALAIQYKESGPSYKGSADRQKGVHDRLVQEGLDCNVGKKGATPFGHDLYLYCSGKLPQDKMRQLAAFFSLVKDADISGFGKDIAPLVSDKVWEIAGNLVSTHGENTYQSGQGILKWSSVHNQWQEDKEIYAKKTIYGDIRALAILRDEHHEIEYKYGIDKGQFSKEGVSKIIANAQKAIAICHQNAWKTHGMDKYLADIQTLLDSGKEKGLVYVSDALGHAMHLSLNTRLYQEGVYGGCNIKGKNIENISAANLSYCEGVLKGTMGDFKDAGNTVVHSVSPKTYSVNIGDPEDGYQMVVILPGPGEWNATLSYALEAYGFDCSKGNVCKKHFKSLEDIRKVALTLSNLKGASEEIGYDCGIKALVQASEVAGTQSDKGAFSFMQKPSIDTKKAWIDMCQKKYGILPPGLTDMEKAVLGAIGPDKTYMGCNFSKSEVVPSLGVLDYCSGVKPNPKGAISAHFSNDDKLDHFFHEKLDRIARVSIQPKGNLYDVQLTDIDMRGALLQQAVVEKLKSTHFGMDCPSNTACSGVMGATGLRQLAAFLSSLHQAYNLSPECTPHAVKHVLKQMATKPNFSIQEVYPWTKADWEKEVCVKVSKEPLEKPEVEFVEDVLEATKPQPITKSYLKSLAAHKGKAPFKVGGCTSTVSKNPTELVAAYCGGVLDSCLSSSKDPSGEKYEALLFSAPPATLSTHENIHKIAVFDKVYFDSKWNSFTVKLTPDLSSIPQVANALTSIFGFTQNGTTFHTPKTTPLVISKVALFLSHLQNVAQLPTKCHGDAVKHALKQAKLGERKPIFPYHHTAWIKHVCSEVEAPVEAKPKYLGDLSLDDLHGLTQMLSNLAKTGQPYDVIEGILTKQYLIEPDADLTSYINEELKNVLITKPEYITELPMSEQIAAEGVVEDGVSKGEMVTMIAASLLEKYPSLDYDSLLTFVKTIKAQIEKPVATVPEEGIPLYYGTLPDEKQAQITAAIVSLAQEGKASEEIREYIELQYPELEWDIHISDIVAVAINEAKAPEKPTISDVAKAIATIKSGQYYGGCHPDKPGSILTPEQVAYCEGIQTPEGKAKAGYVQDIPTDGKTVTRIGHHGDGYHSDVTSPHGSGSIKIRYSEDHKTGKEWYKRLIVVGELLGDMGYDCTSATPYTVTCTASDPKAESLRTTALFLSKLHDIDTLPPGCVDTAVRYALDKAKSETHYLFPWMVDIFPFTTDEWNTKVCQKREIKPIRIDAATLVKELGTAGLLKAAHQLGVSPAGSDSDVAKKLLQAGFVVG